MSSESELEKAAKYDTFYSRGDFVHFKQDTTYVRFLVSKLQDVGTCFVLDVGCGRGYWSGLFKEDGVGQVVGIDFSQIGCRTAREANPDIEFALADARKLPYGDKSFDMVFCQGLSLFSTDDLSTLRTTGVELLRCLKDDGVFVFAYATNLSGKTKGSWLHHRQSTIVNYFPTIGCNVTDIYLVERLFMLRLFGRLAINNIFLKHALPLVCRITGLPICLVVIAVKKRGADPQAKQVT
jgi:ubiquinone/menaquinone biosynthesis C-methylase UbiE